MKTVKTQFGYKILEGAAQVGSMEKRKGQWIAYNMKGIKTGFGATMKECLENFKGVEIAN